jgi:hypothetical protein
MRLLRSALILGLAAFATPAVHADAVLSLIHVGRTTFTVHWSGESADLGQAVLLDWIGRAAHIVRGYYGELPLDAVTIDAAIGDGDHVMNGRTYGAPHARIEIRLGRQVSVATLRDDWVLVHEMIHLALPEVAAEQEWLAEGLATYVEGIARVQAGNMTETALWSEYVADMPKGLPQTGDQGLDRTHTWARTYWGGALFCLLADVRIRAQSANQRGLQDALRAIEREGGGMEQRWPAERIFAAGDRATGTTVLRDLYADMKDKPHAPDLEALWADLGVVAQGDGVRFDDTARLAAVRRAITSANPYCSARIASTTATRQAPSASSIATASDSCVPSPSQ